MKNKDIKIMFLAKYAPKTINSKLPLDVEDIVYAQYHYDIFKILYNEFDNVISICDINKFAQSKPNVDYIFSLYNRMPFKNSEIFVSSLSEYYKLAYLGATPNIRSIAEDKHLAKVQAFYMGFSTPKWFVCDVGNKITSIPFEGPYFVKPRFGASSKGVDSTCFCSDIDSVIDKIKYFHIQNVDAIIEQYIEGTSITVPVLNNFGETKVLPFIIESSTNKHNIITYEQKRKIESGLYRSINNDKQMQNIIENLAIKFFHSVQPLDYTRLDFIIDNNNIPHFIEFNVCCNLGKHAAINMSANSINITYEELIHNIIYSSLFRQKLIDSSCGKKL